MRFQAIPTLLLNFVSFSFHLLPELPVEYILNKPRQIKGKFLLFPVNLLMFYKTYIPLVIYKYEWPKTYAFVVKEFVYYHPILHPEKQVKEADANKSEVVLVPLYTAISK